jgi:VCBS repeat-containing protein
MATTTVSGSTVTFSNSGAAANLSLQTSEDLLLATIDISTILAASGGGTKTTFYSIDNGVAGDDNPLVTTNKAFAAYDTDLLYKDGPVAAWVDGGDTSALGAHVWIGTDGKIHYDATNIADKFQQLAAGETTTDTIKYTIKMANGTLSVGTLTVVINGANDAAVITGTATDSVLEASGVLNGTAGDATASGDLNATDVDSEATFVKQSGVAKTYGTFSIDDTGAWSYTLNDSNAAVQALNTSSAPLHELVTVVTADGTEKVIDITINGANDAAVITGTSTAELTETNAAQSIGGDLNATDVDSAATFVAQSNVAGNHDYGKFSIDAAGTWTYTMDSAHDEFVGGTDYVDSITVKTADGTEKVITVTMHGTNDAALADSDTTNDYDLFDVNDNLQVASDSTGNGHTFVGSSSGETIVASNDPVNGDTVNAQGGDDVVYGRGGNDDLKGQNANDTIYGGSGNDTIIGGGGGDHLWGGSGNDTFVFTNIGDSSSGDLDTIHDFHHGFDKIDVTQINSGDGGAGDFAFGGTVATAHGVWYTEGGGDTTLHFDTNGSTGDEMTIVLTGTGLGLTDLDFLL